MMKIKCDEIVWYQFLAEQRQVTGAVLLAFQSICQKKPVLPASKLSWKLCNHSDHTIKSIASITSKGANWSPMISTALHVPTTTKNNSILAKGSVPTATGYLLIVNFNISTSWNQSRTRCIWISCSLHQICCACKTNALADVSINSGSKFAKNREMMIRLTLLSVIVSRNQPQYIKAWNPTRL